MRPLLAASLVCALLLLAPVARTDPRVAPVPLDEVTDAHGSTVWVTRLQRPAASSPPTSSPPTSPPDSSSPPTSPPDSSPPDSSPPVAAARVIFLHGMCSNARRACERIHPLLAGRGVLACPTGNAACGAAADWRGEAETKAAHLDVSMAAAWSHLGAPRAGGDVLVGFSRGAFVARDVAYARPGVFRGLVLIGAALSPDAARLAAAGVRRIVLASGDFDPARRTMERAAAQLRRDGMPARFVRLGPFGHALPQDLGVALGADLDWVRGAGGPTADAAPGPDGRGRPD